MNTINGVIHYHWPILLLLSLCPESVTLQKRSRERVAILNQHMYCITQGLFQEGGGEEGGHLTTPTPQEFGLLLACMYKCTMSHVHTGVYKGEEHTT